MEPDEFGELYAIPGSSGIDPKRSRRVQATGDPYRGRSGGANDGQVDSGSKAGTAFSSQLIWVSSTAKCPPRSGAGATALLAIRLGAGYGYESVL